MKALITGVAGFIGSHLAESLLDKGMEVWGCDTFEEYHPSYTSEHKRKNVSHFKDHHNFHLIEGDFSGDEVTELILDVGFNYIVHLAAHAGVRASFDDPEKYYDNNVTKSAHLIKTIVKSPYVWMLKFIFASSSSVYGGITETPWKESMDISKPLSPYAGSKKALEDMCYMYHRLSNVPMTGLRFFTVYGPRQRPDMAIAKFTKAIEEGTPIELYGEKEKTFRDYTYIDDIVKGIISTFPGCAPFDIYNLGSGNPVGLGEVLAEIGLHMGKIPVAQELPMQPGDPVSTHASIEKAYSEFGYSPEVNYEEGIKRYVKWFKKNMGILKT